jgi:hypothetical protein
VVERANQFGTVMGLRSPPPLEKNTIGKMGLKVRAVAERE